MSANRKEELVQEASKIDAQTDRAKRRALDHLTRSVEYIQRLQQNQARLGQQICLLDTDTIYIHVMTDHAKHRIVRVMKGTQPSHHDHLRFHFADNGRITIEAHGIRIPLHIGCGQWIESNDGTYMVTPFFFRSEAKKSARLLT